jgi:hypothetical protein
MFKQLTEMLATARAEHESAEWASDYWWQTRGEIRACLKLLKKLEATNV